MIYVDDLRRTTTRNPKWPYPWVCHLLPEPDLGNLGELHALAARIGLRREWFQDHPTLPHYDLTQGKRNLAIKAGAIEIPSRVWAREHIQAREEREHGREKTATGDQIDPPGDC